MKNTLFIIVDDMWDESLLKRPDFSGAGLEKVVLCPLTTDDLIVSKLQSWCSDRGIWCETIPFARSLNEMALELRHEYIEKVQGCSTLRLGFLTLAERFRVSGSERSVWWYGLVAEKNTLKSKSFQRYVTVRLLMYEIRRVNQPIILIDLRDEVLQGIMTKVCREQAKECVSSTYRRSKSIANLRRCMRTIVMILAWWRRVRTGMSRRCERIKALAQCRHLFVTYFPLIDEVSRQTGKFINRYLGPLQRAAEANYEHATATVAIGMDLDGRTKFDGIALAEEFNRNGAKIIFCEEALSPFDLIRSAAVSVLVAARYVLIRRRLRQSLECCGDEILWYIWRDDLDDTFLGGIVLETDLFYRAFRRLFGALQVRCAVSYVAEMHAWEKAMNNAAGEYPQVRTIAIQHTSVPLLLLNYFEPHHHNGNDEKTAYPLFPDSMGCVGDVTKRLIEQCDWPQDRLFVLGALRSHAVSPRVSPSDIETDVRHTITVALSINHDESKEMLRMVISAMRGLDNAIVYIKCHPVSQIDDFPGMDVLSSARSSSPNYIVSEESAELLMGKSDLMIVSSSSVCLTALAYGKPIIVPLLANSLCLNPLYGISDLPVFVSTVDELRDAVLVALNGLGRSDAALEFCAKYYCHHADDDEYLRRVERAAWGEAELC